MKRLKKIALILICTPILLWVGMRIFHRQYQEYYLFETFRSYKTKAMMLLKAKNIIGHQTFSSINQALTGTPMIDLGYASFKVLENEKLKWHLRTDESSNFTISLCDDDLSIKVETPYLNEKSLFESGATLIEIEETTLKTWFEHFWMRESVFNYYLLRLKDKLLMDFRYTAVYAFKSPKMETQGILYVYDNGMNGELCAQSAMIVIFSGRYVNDIYLHLQNRTDRGDVYAISEQIIHTFKFNNFDQEDLPMYREQIKAKCTPIDHDAPKGDVY